MTDLHVVAEDDQGTTYRSHARSHASHVGRKTAGQEVTPRCHGESVYTLSPAPVAPRAEQDGGLPAAEPVMEACAGGTGHGGR